jgi:TM2 domain-containing membrane protein YozV
MKSLFKERTSMTKKAQYLLVGTIISLTLGFAGIDRFYKGDPWLGVLKLFTLGVFGVMYLIDAIIWTIDLGKELRGEK